MGKKQGQSEKKKKAVFGTKRESFLGKKNTEDRGDGQGPLVDKKKRGRNAGHLWWGKTPSQTLWQPVHLKMAR